jgi:MFS transporter, FSR family, fosmidomycin resistance protein
VQEAAWPFIRQDLGLSYAQIGLLVSVPGFVSLAIEPIVGILGDSHRRRALVFGGGVAFALAIAAIAVAPSFAFLLAALILAYPGSGAFVSLSQASLMDLDPASRERNMARWTLVGSIGVVAAPLLLAALVWIGLGWRSAFAALALGSVPLVVLARRLPLGGEEPVDFGAGVRNAFAALRRREVLRWLVLLEVADLMLDVLHGFLALYLVDVVGLEPVHAALVLAVWTGAGLVGDVLLLPLLGRFSGVAYLRVSAALVAIAYPAFLLVGGLPAKLVLLAALGLLNAGWYAIPQARLYGELPGASGSALALGTVSGLIGGAFPLAIGFVASAAGLGAALWIPLAAPLVLLALLPRNGATLER